MLLIDKYSRSCSVCGIKKWQGGKSPTSFQAVTRSLNVNRISLLSILFCLFALTLSAPLCLKEPVLKITHAILQNYLVRTYNTKSLCITNCDFFQPCFLGVLNIHGGKDGVIQSGVVIVSYSLMPFTYEETIQWFILLEGVIHI